MKLVNQKVIHKTLGEGKIIEYNEPYMIVAFAAKEVKFRYPMSFEDFLTAKSEKLAEQVRQDIEAFRISAMVDILQEGKDYGAKEEETEEEAK